ncbi:MAG TPA: hypothetical protein VFO83_01540, partial [Aggregicoccus sp.]|nr:hypothetical protein [Aggregicoccus sp.]
APLRSYALADDAYAPLGGVRWLVSRYPNAKAEVRNVAPTDVGQKKLGHFGFFRDKVRESLWAEASTWLGTVALPPPSR